MAALPRGGVCWRELKVAIALNGMTTGRNYVYPKWQQDGPNGSL